MDPLSAFLAQLLGQPIGSGSIVPNVSTGGGIPSTSSVGSALPGLAFSPYANAGSPYAPGGSPSVGSPVGTATPGGGGSSGLGSDPFLAGSIFNQLFPSSVNQATPSGAAGLGGGGNIGMTAEPTGTANLLSMAAPTGGEVQPGGLGDTGIAAPGESGAGVVSDGGVGQANMGNIAQGAQQGLLGFLGNSLGMNPTLSFANGNFGTSNTSGVPGQTFSLANLMGLLGNMFAGPAFGLGNSALGGVAQGLQGLNTQSGRFSGPLGNFFGNSTPSAAPNQSLSDIVNAPRVSGPLPDLGQPAGPGGIGAPGAPGAPAGVGTATAGEPGIVGIGDPGQPGPVGVGQGIGSVGIAAGGDVGPGTAAAASAPSSGIGPGTGTAPGGDGGGPGDGGSLLCTYCLGNGSYDDKTRDGHQKVFGGLAGRALKDPAMKESFGHYQQASRQILDKIDTLDQGRRKAQLTDLHENLVKPFHAAAMRKDVKGAARILRDQTVKLAQTHGVTIPPEHLAAANKALGGGMDDGAAGA